eukprot:6395353-Pyramimonas_sp.AAC.1
MAEKHWAETFAHDGCVYPNSPPVSQQASYDVGTWQKGTYPPPHVSKSDYSNHQWCLQCRTRTSSVPDCHTC